MLKFTIVAVLAILTAVSARAQQDDAIRHCASIDDLQMQIVCYELAKPKALVPLPLPPKKPTKKSG